VCDKGANAFPAFSQVLKFFLGRKTTEKKPTDLNGGN
jgi:hypothetical protein